MARGDVIIVRFADDFVMGFEDYQDACRFVHDLRERFAKFGLELHPGKTRLIEFSNIASCNPAKLRTCRARTVSSGSMLLPFNSSETSWKAKSSVPSALSVPLLIEAR